MPVPDNVPETCPTLPQLPQLLERLERAWAQAAVGSPSPDLNDYLPLPVDPLRPLILRELVRLDLELRWRRGLPTNLEYYGEHFPELSDTATLPAELIYHEYRIRRQFGDRPALSVYRERYPRQYRRVQELARANQSEAASVSAPSSGKKATPSKDPASPASGTANAPASDTSGIAWPTLPPVEADSSKRSGDVVLPPLPPGITEAEVAAEASSGNGNLLSMVGGYRLLKRLGSGALGEVWKAEAPGGIEVAIKRLSRTLATHEAQYELKSLEHVKRLRHPYLAQIHAFWVQKGRLYIVMELADGSLLDRAAYYRKQGQTGIPLDELLRCMREAAEALDFLHGKGVHHRDIKPANILLLKGHTKVADFGLARPLGSEESVVNATFCGTPAFMAPEVWDNKFSTHSDQWSLAVTYLELRLNRRLFQNRSIQALMTEIRAGRLNLEPLKKNEQRAVKKALAQDPRHRYPTCTAFIQALEAVHQPAPVAAAPTRRRWLTTALVVLACLVVGGLLASVLGFLFRPPAAAPARISFEEPQPLRMHTGDDEVHARLNFVRENCADSIDLVAEDLPRHITVRTTPAQTDDGIDIAVRVDGRVHPGSYRIHLHTAEGLPAAEVVVPLTILYLPRNYEPVSAETEPDAQGVDYYKRIRRRLGDKQDVEFVLIPQDKPREELQDGEVRDTFYISRDKITRGQFGFFVAEDPKRVDPVRWKAYDRDDPRMPVRNVTVEEAHAFAVSIDGRLPTFKQWDKAAGLHHPARGKPPYLEGPYKGKWEDEPKPNVAVGLLEDRPYSVGVARDDTSPYGCRDMAGNGQEWTRNVTGNRLVPLGQERKGKIDDTVLLRGWAISSDRPLTYKELIDNGDSYRWGYDDATRDIGFRVVLEPHR